MPTYRSISRLACGGVLVVDAGRPPRRAIGGLSEHRRHSGRRTAGPTASPGRPGAARPRADAAWLVEPKRRDADDRADDTASPVPLGPSSRPHARRSHPWSPAARRARPGALVRWLGPTTTVEEAPPPVRQTNGRASIVSDRSGRGCRQRPNLGPRGDAAPRRAAAWRLVLTDHDGLEAGLGDHLAGTWRQWVDEDRAGPDRWLRVLQDSVKACGRERRRGRSRRGGDSHV